MKIINSYVAPWVLPNQPFPIHCVWEPEQKLAKIMIEVPKRYKLVDTLNFTIFEADKKTNQMIVNASELKSNNYFGIILRYKGINFPIEKRDEVVISFFDSNERLMKTLSLQTRIIRPKIELLSYPREITVTDMMNPRNLIKLELLHRGFGTANLDIEVLHSGSNITKNDSLYFQVLQDTIVKILKICDENVEMPESIEIDDLLTRTVAESLFKSELQENLPFKIDKTQMKKLKEIFNDKTKKEAIYRTVYASLRPLLLTALLYYSEKHPAEDIKLIDGKVVATIRDRVDELTILIKYTDSFENKYEPLVAKITVIDKRSTENVCELDVPINLSWKKDVLKLGD